MASHRAVSPVPVSALRPSPRVALPFAFLGVLGVALATLPPHHLGARQASELGVALLLAPLLAWTAMEVLRRDRAGWRDTLGCGLAFVLVGVLRDATGGTDSVLSSLPALPVLWVALFGSRADLLVGALAAVATSLGPFWLLGAPRYPPDHWSRAVLWLAVSAAVGAAVRQVARTAGHPRHTAGDPPMERPVEDRPDHGTLGPDASSRLAAVMRSATLAALVTTDHEGRVTGFGAGAEALFGRQEGEALGLPIVDLIRDPVEMQEVAAELGVAAGFPVLAELAGRRAPGRSWVCVRADGEPIAVRMVVSELHEHRVLTGYLMMAADETEAVRAQHELAQAEARWRVLMDHLPDTVMLLVERGTGVKVVTGGGVLARQARNSPGRWLQKLATQGNLPLDTMLESAFAGEEQRSPVSASPAVPDHEVVVSPLPAPPGGRPQALVMVRDVSRDRMRERAITAAKQRADRLFDDAPQGIALLDLRGTVVRANPAMCRLFGCEDLLGRPLGSLSAAAEDSTVRRHLEELLGGTGHAVAHWTVVRADGSELHVGVTSTLLAGEDGAPDQVLTNLVDVSERHRYEQELAALADTDPLTGLANRRRFHHELNRHVAECRRYGVRGGVLLLDLDHFKAVNDTLGHAAGDELLTLVAEILQHRLRSTDVVARLGGDEFAVLLPHADRKAVELVSQTVVDEIRGRLCGLGDTREQVTVSVGGVLVAVEHGSGDGVLEAADSAMYAAKAAGRNQYVVQG